MGGDPPATPLAESSAATLAAYKQNLPDILKIMSDWYGPLEQTAQTSRESIAPQEAALNAKLMKDYLPQYTQAQTEAEGSALTGQGGKNVLAADALQRQIDQPFYTAREAGSKSLADLLGGMDPNKLTGGEETQVERGLNRQGVNTGEFRNPSNTGTINAALTYGDALQKKKSNVAAAINTATGFMSGARTNNDVFGQATGRSGTTNFGNNLFNSTGAGNQAFNQGQNTYNQLTNLQSQANDINANRRDSLDRFTGVMGSLPNVSV